MSGIKMPTTEELISSSVAECHGKIIGHQLKWTALDLCDAMTNNLPMLGPLKLGASATYCYVVAQSVKLGMFINEVHFALSNLTIAKVCDKFPTPDSFMEGSKTGLDSMIQKATSVMIFLISVVVVLTGLNSAYTLCELLTYYHLKLADPRRTRLPPRTQSCCVGILQLCLVLTHALSVVLPVLVHGTDLKRRCFSSAWVFLRLEGAIAILWALPLVVKIAWTGVVVGLLSTR